LVGSRDWRVDWTAGSFLRQVSLQAADREREGAVARFQFSRAPIELTAKIVRNESRSACEPILDISFWRDRMQVDGEFHYSFSGPRPEFLLIDSRGWELDVDALSSQRYVRRASIDPTNPERWRLDLDPGLSEESLVLSFTLTRPMDRFGELSIPLPSPVASTVSAAIVSLRSTEDLEVLPRLSAVQGTIVPRPSQLPGEREGSAGVERPAATRPMGSASPSGGSGTISASLPADALIQWLRIQSLADVEALDCRVTVRPQRVDVASRVRVQIDDETAQVTQTLDYVVRYVPATGGLLALRREVVENGQLELRVDGQIIQTRPELNELEGIDPNWEVLRFDLPRPVTGAWRLEATFSLPIEQPIDGDSTTSGEIPLVIPLQAPDERALAWRSGVLRADAFLAIQPIGDLAREVEFDVPSDRIIVGSDDSWRIEDQGLSGDRREYRFIKIDRDAVRAVPFGLAVGQGSSTQAPRVLATWVQSLCAPEYRRDRVTMRIATSRPSIDLTLPSFVKLGTVAVDGVEQQGLADQLVNRRLTIVFAENVVRDEHTIELWYRYPRNRSFDRSLELDLPRVDQVDWIEQAYWEVVLPADEYVLLQPLGMVSENRTDWHWWGWTETPRLNTADLEDRLGIVHQRPLDGSFRHQLYASFGQEVTGRVWTARRWEVLVFGCALLFLLGTAAVVLRIQRRPIATLLASAIAFGLAATIQPAGQWIAQLALFVSVFVVLGAYLQWLWARPARRLVTRPATAVERSGARSRDQESHRSSPRRSLSGTDTAPAAPEEVRA
ncbi:MAG: hypothetical protein KDA83_08615, partial [Planctomycetales bacterium]|nr:hypothetical protein [Planctomycetales bacterium]